MELISYAQNQEDVLLWRALKHVRHGFYIDAGAADPTDLSVTRLFYDRGWRGLNLEPNPAFASALQAARPRDINLSVLAGAAEGMLSFNLIEGTGLSTQDGAVALRHGVQGHQVRPIQVPCHTLAALCAQYRADGPIHFLKIDTEGSEAEVLRGADFVRFRPWVLVIEAIRPETHQPDHASWEPALLQQGYVFAWFDGLNRFYVAAEHEAALLPHFQVPPNVFDGFVRTADLLPRLQASEAYGQDEHDARLRAEAHAAREREQERQQAREQAGLLAQQAAAGPLQALAEAARGRGEAEHRASLLSVQLTHAQVAMAQLAESVEAAGQRLDGVLAQARAAQERAEVAAAQSAEAGQQRDAALRRAEAAQADASWHNAMAEARCAAVEQQLGLFRTSTSWRLTRPLRATAYLLRGQIGLGDLVAGLAGRRPARLRGQPAPVLAAPPPAPEPPPAPAPLPEPESAAPPPPPEPETLPPPKPPALPPRARRIQLVLRQRQPAAETI